VARIGGWHDADADEALAYGVADRVLDHIPDGMAGEHQQDDS